MDRDSDDDGDYLLHLDSDSDHADQYSEYSDYSDFLEQNQGVEQDEEMERERPVDMGKFSRKRKRRHRNGTSINRLSIVPLPTVCAGTFIDCLSSCSL